MNNTFFNKDIFPNKSYESVKIPNYTVVPFEDSYMDSLIRNNIGKQVCIFVTIPSSNDFRDFKFNGILEQSGKDYVVLSEPSTGKWHLIPSIYINFITFDENINYSSN
jgi:spore germination protein Q